MEAVALSPRWLVLRWKTDFECYVSIPDVSRTIRELSCRFYASDFYLCKKRKCESREAETFKGAENLGCRIRVTDLKVRSSSRELIKAGDVKSPRSIASPGTRLY